MYVFQKCNYSSYTTINYFYTNDLKIAEKLLGDLWDKYAKEYIEYTILVERYEGLRSKLITENTTLLKQAREANDFKTVRELQVRENPYIWNLMKPEEQKLYFKVDNNLDFLEPLEIHLGLKKCQFVHNNLSKITKIEVDKLIITREMNGD